MIMSDNFLRRAEFLLSAHTLDQCPEDSGCEVAFVGRSNAGKSSVINTLTGKKALARTSKTPGRTQQINFFILDGHRRLVDLPGYGFARVPPSMQAHWFRTINDYLQTRRSLAGLILIMDVRRNPGAEEAQIPAWCEAVGLPVHVLLNKADKLSFGAASRRLLAVRSTLERHGCTVQLFSARDRSGLEEAAAVVQGWLADDGKDATVQKKNSPG
jgi:GTP-binding protein